jgi:CrcB protein
MDSIVLWIGVALCGGAGSVLRFVVDGTVARRALTGLPIGTLVVNVSGAFVLGLLDGIVLDHDVALLAGTGVVGAYTTFSTWMLETHRLAEERRLAPAVLNVVVSMVAGLAAAWIGLQVGGAR